MLRGLLMRQGFKLAEGIICLIIIAIALVAFRDLRIMPQADGHELSPGDPQQATTTIQNTVSPRKTYNTIITSKIFGKAATYVHNPPKTPKKPTPPPKPKVITESKLPLTLKGTLYAGEDSIFSSASIEIKEKGTAVKSFFIGDQVIDRVILLKVFKNKVLLDNKRANRQEWLEHELNIQVAGKTRPGAKGAGATDLMKRAQAATRPSSGRPAGQKLVTLDRKTIVKKMEDEYERIASTVDVIEIKDDKGNVTGISTPEVESIGVLKELGFKNGDTLVSINNDPVRDQGQLTTLANKYRNSSVVRVGILRGGQPLNFTYRLR